VRVLVTGGAGFIGSHLALRLRAEGAEVVVAALPGEQTAHLEASGVTVLRGDVRDPRHCVDAVSGCELVFHLAALTKLWGPHRLFMEVTVGGTHNVLAAAAAAGARRLVLLSSLAVHDFSGYRHGDEDAPRDGFLTPYSESKILAEDHARDFHSHGRLQTVIVRPGLFPFGPRDRNAFPRLARGLEQGRFAHVAGGRALLCTAYVENLVEGLWLAGVHKAAAGETFVIGDPEPVRWVDLIERFCAAIDVPLPRRSLPAWTAWLAATALETLYRSNLVTGEPPFNRYLVAQVSRDFFFSSAKAERLLGYQAPVDLDTAVARTAAWYRAARG